MSNPMKKILTLLTIALSLVIINHSCKPDSEDELLQESGSIYGVVTDFATGEPVKNANVQLRPSGETTLTGSDGRYEFLDLPNGNYSITVSKAEYTDLIDDFVITVKTGRSMRRDVQIKKIPTTLQIIDNNGNQISSLDFGNDVDSKQFVIFNSGTVAIECNVVASCEWIKSVSNVINPILPGSVCSVIITIDRSKLHAGINTTYVHVVSNNGNRELKITATGKELLPQVTTLPVTYIDGSDSPFNNTFNALHDNHKQIIMASDKSINDYKMLEERLKTRFKWGLTESIMSPEFELKKNIIKNKIMINDFDLNLSEDVINFIANNCGNDIRNLEGSVIRLLSYKACLNIDEITLDIAKEALTEFTTETVYRVNSVSKIIDIVAKYFNLEVPVIKGKMRKKNI